MSADYNYVAELFLAHDLAHRIHLGTSNHARPAVLNQFYLCIVDHVDTYQRGCCPIHGRHLQAVAGRLRRQQRIRLANRSDDHSLIGELNERVAVVATPRTVDFGVLDPVVGW